MSHLYMGWILCYVKGHLYRRAHKHEDAAYKYCVRCQHPVAVRKRRATVEAS